MDDVDRNQRPAKETVGPEEVLPQMGRHQQLAAQFKQLALPA